MLSASLFQDWIFRQALAASTAQQLVHWPPGGGGVGGWGWVGGRGWWQGGEWTSSRRGWQLASSPLHRVTCFNFPSKPRPTRLGWQRLQEKVEKWNELGNIKCLIIDQPELGGQIINSHGVSPTHRPLPISQTIPPPPCQPKSPRTRAKAVIDPGNKKQGDDLDLGKGKIPHIFQFKWLNKLFKEIRNWEKFWGEDFWWTKEVFPNTYLSKNDLPKVAKTPVAYRYWEVNWMNY